LQKCAQKCCETLQCTIISFGYNGCYLEGAPEKYRCKNPKPDGNYDIYKVRKGDCAAIGGKSIAPVSSTGFEFMARNRECDDNYVGRSKKLGEVNLSKNPDYSKYFQGSKSAAACAKTVCKENQKAGSGTFYSLMTYRGGTCYAEQTREQ
jgi:hypothetical protein